MSPLARLQPLLDRYDPKKAPSAEQLLAKHDGAVVVGTDGIEFGKTIWYDGQLRQLTTLPPASKGKRPRLELRYDAAALSRDTLGEVTLVVLDPEGVVLDRVVCRRRSKVQATADRDREARARAVYENDLERRRTAAQTRAAFHTAGSAAGETQDDIAKARARQGRPGELGVSAARGKHGRPPRKTGGKPSAHANPVAEPMTAGSRTSRQTSPVGAERPAKPSRASAAVGRLPVGPATAPAVTNAPSTAPFNAFRAFAAARKKAGPENPSP